MRRQLFGIEVEVVNGGISGYTLADEQTLLEKVLAPLSPDLIVVYPGFNDFGTYCRPPGRRQPPLQGLPTLQMPEWWMTDDLVLKNTVGLRSAPPTVAGTKDPDAMNLSAYRAQVASLIRSSQDRGESFIVATVARSFRREQPLPLQEALSAEIRSSLPCFTLEGMHRLFERHNDILKAEAANARVPVIELDKLIPGGNRYFSNTHAFHRRSWRKWRLKPWLSSSRLRHRPGHRALSLHSLHFFVFLAAVFGLSQALRRQASWRKQMLLAASYYFYMCWDWRFAALLLLISAVTYIAGARIGSTTDAGQKRAWLVAAAVLCLATLALAKFADFFVAGLAALLDSNGLHIDPRLLQIALPLGISFYTFQSLSYVIDVHRGQQAPCTRFADFALFVAFFPTLLAGPVTRAHVLLPQIEKAAPAEPTQVESGWVLILRGFVRKMAFADVLAAHLVDPAFANPSIYTPVFLLIALYAYSMQIYMDVAGYTDIARGMARMLGFDLPVNFNRPYQATSVSAFWQRWHITVSSFFRDYLFIGLGGSRYGNVYLNLMITFIAIGIWHGAGWTFLIYGTIHGSVVCFERWWRKGHGVSSVANPAYWRTTIQIALTFHIVSFSRIFFRSADLSSARQYGEALLNFSGGGIAPFDGVGLAILGLAAVLHCVPRSGPTIADVFVRHLSSFRRRCLR